MNYKVIFTFIISLILSANLFGSQLQKELTYNKYTLKDNYKYGKTSRSFQWDKIEQYLDIIDSFEKQYVLFGTLKNYKNANGVPPKTRNNITKTHQKESIERDAFGVRRYQGIPLYELDQLDDPVRYGLDGSLVMITDIDHDGYIVKFFGSNKQYKIPDKYVRELMVSKFPKVIFIDRKNQNTAILEKEKGVWKVRSMNPATTGLEAPPYKLATPTGVFVVQDKREKMYYLKDGSKTDIAGFAPYATRFSGGGYIHGVPLVNPNTKIIEYSATLGTTPRSHMCVRNATSHAKYIYDWTKNNQDLIIVIE